MTSSSQASPKGLLLDVDGTLLDSNDAHARAWLAALADHGIAAHYDPVRSMIGKGGDKLLAELFGIDAEGTLGKAISASRKDVFARDHLPHLKPTAGARALLERLRDAGIALVVASSATGEELQALLDQAGVADLIEAAATSSDAEASKPDPDIVQSALKKAGLDAGAALMLGDTPYDIDSARKAGVGCIALRCGGWWSDAELAGALAVYDDPGALLERLAESPLVVR